MVWACYMLPVPILPEEAINRSISLDIVGIILAVYTITFLLASFIIGKMMALWGKIRFLNMALILLFLTTFSFGIIMFIKEKNIFIVVATLLRLVQGLACGTYSVIIYSMVPECYPERIEEVFSYMELFTGISTSVAPLIGMILFQLFGSGITFMSFSVLYLLLLIMTNKNIKFEGSASPGLKKIKSEGENYEGRSILDLIKNRQFIVGFGIYTINSIGFFVINPILGERVKQITGDVNLIGVSFFVFCGSYALGGIGLGQCFKKFKPNKKTIFVLSSIMIFLAYGLMGLTNSISYLLIALVLLGFGEAFCVIPYIPEAIELGINIFPEDYAWVGDMASLFWNMGFAIGEFVGPILGGSLTSSYGFEFCVIFYAFMVAGMLAVYLMFGSVLARYTALDERMLSSYASFATGKGAKFFTHDNVIFRSKPIFLSH